MSEIKVNSIKGVAASAAAITVNNTDGTCTANLTNRTNKNLIINGSCIVAQRGTDITTSSAGFHCVDRIHSESTSADEAPRRQQVDVSSSSTPYTLGFRKAYKLTNGNQTSGAGAGDIMNIRYNIEAQDIANSGWNYTSTSSFITLQFWIKSSVSQNFNMYMRTRDGTNQTYAFDTGTLSADTWTKITKTIPGNSNIELNNDNGQGLQINFGPFWGTDRTDNSVTNNVWQTYNSTSRMKDNTTTWYTTDDATLEITGVQLEVGSVATDFEHRSFAQELDLCKRYYFRNTSDVAYGRFCQGQAVNSTGSHHRVQYPVAMRAAPTFATGGNIVVWEKNTVRTISGSITISQANTNTCDINANTTNMTGGSACAIIANNDATAYFEFIAEL